MIVLAKLIGILMVCMGIVNIINPALMKKMIAFWQKGKNIYLGGLLRCLFGIIFLLSATQARIPLVIYVLGVIILLGALAIFTMGLKKMKAILIWWDSRPYSILRAIAFIVLIIGGLVIYSA